MRDATDGKGTDPKPKLAREKKEPCSGCLREKPKENRWRWGLSKVKGVVGN